jgi:hypothetical protein
MFSPVEARTVVRPAMSTVRYQRYLHNTGLDRQPIILPIRCHSRNIERAVPDNHQSSLRLACVGDTHI